jgi:hypothetical protein
MPVQAIVQHVLGSLNIGDTISAYGKRALRRIAGVFMLMMVGLLLVVFAVAFASWSGYLAAEPALGPAKAALVVTVGLIVLAGLFFLAGWRFISQEPSVPKPRKGKAPAAPASGTASLLPISVEDAELIIKLLKDRVEDDPISSTIVSLCSGYVAGHVVLNRR